MKKLLLLLLTVAMFAGCQKVPAGNVGVKFYLLGSEKGVDSEELSPGRYWLGVNEELYLFPTFTQNYVWTEGEHEGSLNDESITFQTMEGMQVGADVGITYHIQPDKVTGIFQRYKKGIDEITDVFLRNMVRDAFVQISSEMSVQDVYGKGKQKLLTDVQQVVKQQTAPLGIEVDKIYLVGSLRLPTQVVNALNTKIEATQRAEQRENELREAEAQAKKAVAEANGEAAAILARATAQAKANRKLAASLTPALVRYQAIAKWDGKMPQVAGTGGMPLINLK